jgi:hypothetical protein
MKIKDLFNEDVQKILTEESLTAIEEAVTSKVDKAVEAALLEQDEVHAGKLELFVKKIDEEHSKKTKKIMESIEKNNASKLLKVVKKYEREIQNEAVKFKKLMIGSISSYLEEFLSESISKEELQTAVRNKTAYTVLENLRKVLTIDSALMNGSIQDAVLDGKVKLEEKDNTIKSLQKQVKLLKESNDKTSKALILEQKTVGFPKHKKDFVIKALSDKSPEFIEENIDYTIRLFDKSEKSKLKVIKEEAIEQRKFKPDFVQTEKVVTENINTNNDMDEYMSELSKRR